MAKASIVGTTAVTTGDEVYFNPPVQRITAQVGGAPFSTNTAGSFTVEASLNGSDWTTVIAATTFADTRVVSVGTSTGHLWSVLRANLTAHSAGGAVSVYLDGK